MSFSRSDLVWNRACNGGGRDPGPGDIALAALLLCHGYAMNGGVFHAIEGLDEKALTRAAEGYRFLGLEAVVSLLDRARGIPADARGPSEAAMNTEYGRLANDAALDNCFRRQFEAHPEWFAPLVR